MIISLDKLPSLGQCQSVWFVKIKPKYRLCYYYPTMRIPPSNYCGNFLSSWCRLTDALLVIVNDVFSNVFIRVADYSVGFSLLVSPPGEHDEH